MEDARTGVLHILEGRRRRQVVSEAEQAGRHLAETIAAGSAREAAATEAALARLEAKRKQLEESDEHWFELDRVDEADI